MTICLYLHAHQPIRLKKYSYFEIGHQHHYEDDNINKKILTRIIEKCYLPTNQLLYDLIKKHNGKFKLAISISGPLIEQLKKYSPITLDSFKQLAKTDCVEFVAETYYHSLCAAFSKKEFIKQVKMHKRCIQKEFNQKPKTFRNIGIIYDLNTAKILQKMGFKTLLIDSPYKIINAYDSNFVYQPFNKLKLKMLIKNVSLSDDIHIRFDNKKWIEHPLTAEKYANWLSQLEKQQIDVINLFISYETFGELQRKKTGIFDFLYYLPEKILEQTNCAFTTPDQVAHKTKNIQKIEIPEFNLDKNPTGWYGNVLQKDSLKAIYAIENRVKSLRNKKLLRDWRILQIADHIYYMCIKWSGDYDIYSYLSPYQDAYESYIFYQNILTDFYQQLEKKIENKIKFIKRFLKPFKKSIKEQYE